MERWNGKVAVVTGASSGIGSAIVEKLVQNGMIVAGLARNKAKLEELSKNLKGKPGVLHPVVADITKESDILKAFEFITNKLGRIHVLINNAGVASVASLTEGTTDGWRRTFETNVMGLCIATREAIQNMKSNNVDGHIIHMNSTVGHGSTSHPTDMYGASKYAVTSLTESLRKQLNMEKSKIKITSISPGFVDTPMLYNMSKESNGLFPIEFVEHFRSTNPAMKAEDVADTVLYVLGTPPHVQIHEIIMRAVGETI